MGPTIGFGFHGSWSPSWIRAPDGTDIVELSVDGREFGSSDAPGPRRISCTPDWACADYCAPTLENQTPGCPDVTNGWYRVRIIPGFLKWGRRESSFSPLPNAGPGFRCGNDGHPELEFCWDPPRFLRQVGLPDNALDVPYTAMHISAATTWVSLTRDSDDLPLFYTTCNSDSCKRFIETAGATIELEFPFSALKNWQRIEARLQEFAKRLVEPVSDRY